MVKRIHNYFFLVLLIFFLFPIVVCADIKINEFSPETSPQSVEILNTSTQSADISGWYIDDSGGTTYYTVPSNTNLYPNSCAVFEGDFNLNKSSTDTIRLFDSTAHPNDAYARLIDSYTYKTGPGPNYSYVRSPDAGPDWISSLSNLGYFNSTGETCMVFPTETPTPIPSPTPSPPDKPSPTYTQSPTATVYPTYSNILINEVFPNPPNGQKEWVELYNNNDYEVILEGWYLDDAENTGSSPKRFSVSISAHQYAVIELDSSILNNNGDMIRLLDAEKMEKDGLEYPKSQQERSFGRFSLEIDELCLQDSSKSGQNKPCIDISPLSTAKIGLPSKIPIQNNTNSAAAIQWSTISKPSQSEGYTTTRLQPAILGVSDSIQSYDAQNYSPNHAVKNLSFVSFSYSILTIFSVLIKIRNGLAS